MAPWWQRHCDAEKHTQGAQIQHDLEQLLSKRRQHEEQVWRELMNAMSRMDLHNPEVRESLRDANSKLVAARTANTELARLAKSSDWVKKHANVLKAYLNEELGAGREQADPIVVAPCCLSEVTEEEQHQNQSDQTDDDNEETTPGLRESGQMQQQLASNTNGTAAEGEEELTPKAVQHNIGSDELDEYENQYFGYIGGVAVEAELDIGGVAVEAKLDVTDNQYCDQFDDMNEPMVAEVDESHNQYDGYCGSIEAAGHEHMAVSEATVAVIAKQKKVIQERWADVTDTEDEQQPEPGEGEYSAKALTAKKEKKNKKKKKKHRWRRIEDGGNLMAEDGGKAAESTARSGCDAGPNTYVKSSRDDCCFVAKSTGRPCKRCKIVAAT